MLKEAPLASGAGTRTRQVWRCAACAADVAADPDAGSQRFVNPDGVEFEIARFRDAPGCRAIGEPVSYWTWFPGCAWQPAVCAACGAHLGWRFSGAEEFFGLIVDHLIAPSA